MDTIEEAGYGRGYVELDADWRYFLGRMNGLRDTRGMTVIYLAHEEIRNFSDPERDSYDRYRLRLHKRAAEMVVEHADVLGFMNYVTAIRKEKTGFNKEIAKASSAGLRTLYLTERPAFTAKNRFDMPDSVLVTRGEGYAALAKYLPGHRNVPANTTAG
jgi:hypothetical protein